MEQEITGQEMCEIIIRAIKIDDPDNPLMPEDIWNYSPTGELHLPFTLYQWAVKRLHKAYPRVKRWKDSANRIDLGRTELWNLILQKG